MDGVNGVLSIHDITYTSKYLSIGCEQYLLKFAFNYLFLF